MDVLLVVTGLTNLAERLQRQTKKPKGRSQYKDQKRRDQSFDLCTVPAQQNGLALIGIGAGVDKQIEFGNTTYSDNNPSCAIVNVESGASTQKGAICSEIP